MVAAMLPILAKLNAIFKVRMCEHLGVPAFTGKRLNGGNNFAIKNIIYFPIIHLALTPFTY